MNSSPKSETIKIALAFAAIYLVWGSSFYGTSIALKSFPPFLLSALRLLFAGFLLLLVCIFRRENVPSTADIIKNAACGVVMFTGGIVAVVWALQHVSPSLASVIITAPFWFILLDRRQWKFYFSNKWIVTGLLAGLAGVILLLGFRQSTTGGDHLQIVSIVVMILGSAMWVLGALFIKYHPSQISTFVSTSIQLIAAGVVCSAISISGKDYLQFDLTEVRLDSFVAMAYLSIVSSLITFMAFVWLIKIKPPAVVSTYAYVNPVVGVLIGYGFGNESMSTIQLLALAIILGGLIFVNIPKYKSIAA